MLWSRREPLDEAWQLVHSLERRLGRMVNGRSASRHWLDDARRGLRHGGADVMSAARRLAGEGIQDAPLLVAAASRSVSRHPYRWLMVAAGLALVASMVGRR